MDNIVF